MNYRFLLSHNNFVAETQWYGTLTYEIIAEGIVQQNQWILNNTDRLPLVQIADYSKANLDNITENDLLNLKKQIEEEQSLFPEMTWIGIMPSDIKYGDVRSWLDHVETFLPNSHLARNREKANGIISSVLLCYQE